MAFTTLTEGMQALLKLWGSIQAAAGTRLGVAGAWQAVKDAGYATGETGGGATIADMNALYGLAVANRTAFENLANARDSSVITSTMIGLTPNARSLTARNTVPSYNIRVNYSYSYNGEFTTDWLTIRAPYELNTTVGDLMTTLQSLLSTMFTQIVPGSAYAGRTLLTIIGISINQV